MVVVPAKFKRWLPRIFLGLIGAASAIAVILFIPINIKISVTELHGIKPGMSRTQVVASLAQRGVDSLIPELPELIVIQRKNAHSLDTLMRSDGICVTDGKGLALKVRIADDGTVIKLNESFQRIPELTNVESRAELQTALQEAFAHYPTLTAANCIPDIRWVGVVQMAPEGFAYLQRYSAWAFNEPNSYSRVVLRFSEDTLTRIEYYWRPFELP